VHVVRRDYECLARLSPFVADQCFRALSSIMTPFITSKNFLHPHMLIVVAVSTVNKVITRQFTFTVTLSLVRVTIVAGQ